MSITLGGWGSQTVTTWGFGGGMAGYVISVIAQYIGRAAYTCTIDRECIEIKSRDKGRIVLRVKLEDLSERAWDVLLERTKPRDVSIREKGELIQREEETLLQREKQTLLLRYKPDAMPERVWQTLVARAKPIDVAVRSEGWPVEEICVDFDPYE